MSVPDHQHEFPFSLPTQQPRTIHPSRDSSALFSLAGSSLGNSLCLPHYAGLSFLAVTVLCEIAQAESACPSPHVHELDSAERRSAISFICLRSSLPTPSTGRAVTWKKLSFLGSHSLGMADSCTRLISSSTLMPSSTWSTTSFSPFCSSVALVTTNRCSAAPSALSSASSTSSWGTISPPIFENRERRPVMAMKPSSSRRAMSPVMYQPSSVTT